MADFRMKLFVLAGMATVFAGMASAQNLCGTATANAVFVRVESNDDQVADTTVTCTAPATPAGTISMTVYLSPSVNITSATLGSGNSAKSETLAGLTASFPGTAFTSGTVSGNSVTFSGIAVGACAPVAPATTCTFTLTITNIKIQASTVATGSGVPTGISETIFVSGTNTTPSAVTTGSAVAYVSSGLNGIKSDKAIPNPLCNETTAWGSGAAYAGLAYPGYGAAPLPPLPPSNFTVIFAEAFPNSFKTQGSATVGQATGAGTPGGAAPNAALGSWYVNHTETGLGFSANGTTNQASSGTRIKIIFNNIPANVAIFVPTTFGGAGAVVTEANANSAVLTLIASETGAYTGSVVAPSAANAAPGAPDDKHGPAGPAFAAPLTVTSGSATAIYEVTTVSTAPATFTIPVFLAAAAGVPAAPTTAITATVSFGPIGASSNVPNFVNGSSTTTVNGSNFAACSTTLLFPFVTNQLGFESGLAIANTGADLLAVNKSGAPVSSVAGQAGTCTLTFFGNATASSNPPAFTTAAPVVPGTSWTGTLTSVVGGTPGNFGGYLIAYCNFLYAHGFTYIAYNLGQANGMAMGYLSLEVDTTGTGTNLVRSGGLGGIAATSGNPEQLGN